MAKEIVYDARGLIKDLEAIQPGIKKELKKAAAEEAEPSLSAVRNAIKLDPPLSGMGKDKNLRGRLAWGQRVPANKVTFGISITGRKKTAITPLFKLVVSSPMTAIADVAGKGSGVPRSDRTKEYRYRGGTRTHKVSTQGRSMIYNLRMRNRSNFVYPAVEKSLPMTERKLKLVLDRYAAKVNRKLN